MRAFGLSLIAAGVLIIVLSLIECFLGMAGVWKALVSPSTERTMIDAVYAQIGAFVVLIGAGAVIVISEED